MHGWASLRPSAESMTHPMPPQIGQTSAAVRLSRSTSILRQAGLDQDPALARPLEVALEVGEARLPADPGLVGVALVGGPGVRHGLRDRNDAPLLALLPEGELEADAGEDLAVARLI